MRGAGSIEFGRVVSGPVARAGLRRQAENRWAEFIFNGMRNCNGVIADSGALGSIPRLARRRLKPRLHSADKLVVYHADNGRVVIIEYEVYGQVLRTGVPYDNRFVSIITVADRKIVHWRDYMDSLAAWNALNPRSS